MFVHFDEKGTPMITLDAPPPPTWPDDRRGASASLVEARELSGDVPTRIAESWRRSIASGLDPRTVDAPFVGDVDGAPIAAAAAPVLDRLADDLAGARVAIVLSNGHGQVVDRRASDPYLLEELDRIRLAPGYVYAEDVVGTNGIGTALAGRCPTAVDGPEHFAEALSTVACAGAPITNAATGAVAGVLALTSLAGDNSALMLPLAMRAAGEIEQRLVDDDGLADRLVLQRFLQERRRAKGPLVILSDRRMLANAAADRLVGPDDEPILRACTEVVPDHEGTTTQLKVSRGTIVVVGREPIVDAGLQHGTILRLAPPTGGRRSRALFGWSSLTATERAVTDLVAGGLTNREAAEQLFLSPHTVGFHLRSIYRKLAINSRVDLTRAALENESVIDPRRPSPAEADHQVA